MGIGPGLMYVVVVQKFTFAISSPDEFLYWLEVREILTDFHNSFTAEATVNTFSSVKKMK